MQKTRGARLQLRAVRVYSQVEKPQSWSEHKLRTSLIDAQHVSGEFMLLSLSVYFCFPRLCLTVSLSTVTWNELTWITWVWSVGSTRAPAAETYLEREPRGAPGGRFSVSCCLQRTRSLWERLSEWAHRWQRQLISSLSRGPALQTWLCDTLSLHSGDSDERKSREAAWEQRTATSSPTTVDSLTPHKAESEEFLSESITAQSDI